MKRYSLIYLLVVVTLVTLSVVVSPHASAQCVAPTLDQKWGGMTHVNYTFGIPDIHTLQFQVVIDNNPGIETGLYLQLYDANIDGSAQYFGFFTEGKVRFRRFGTANAEDISVPSGSTFEANADPNNGEGSILVSVQREFGSLPAGIYSVRITRDTYDGVGDWFKYYVTFPGGSEQYIGAIRFPRATAGVPASFHDGGGTWTEDTLNNGPTLYPVPLWHVRTAVTANGGIQPISAIGSYSSMPNSDIYAESLGGLINHVIGGCTERVHPAGTLWTTLLPNLTVETGTTVVPATATVEQSVSFSGPIKNAGTAAATKSPGFPNTFQIVKVNPTSPSQIPIIVANGTTVNVDFLSLKRTAAASLASLAVGATSPPVTGSYSFQSAGTYYVSLCANINDKWEADDPLRVSDSNSKNDCGDWMPVIVRNAPTATVLTEPTHVSYKGSSKISVSSKDSTRCALFKSTDAKASWTEIQYTPGVTYSVPPNEPWSPSTGELTSRTDYSFRCLNISPALPTLFSDWMYARVDVCPQSTPVWNGTACVPPKIDGGWSAWSPASCPTACGLSESSQTRTCTNPVPSGGGADCGGSATQTCAATPACVCAAPLTKTVSVACDARDGYTVSGSVTRSQAKSAYPGCTFPSTVTADNSIYMPPDSCVYTLIPTGTWTPATLTCPQACGTKASTLTQTCTGGTCSGTAQTLECSATAACACSAPLTRTVTVACDAKEGYTFSGAVIRTLTKSAIGATPSCAFPAVNDSTNPLNDYTSDTCEYTPVVTQPTITVSLDSDTTMTTKTYTAGDPAFLYWSPASGTTCHFSGSTVTYDTSGAFIGTTQNSSISTEPYVQNLTLVCDTSAGSVSTPLTLKWIKKAPPTNTFALNEEIVTTKVASVVQISTYPLPVLGSQAAGATGFIKKVPSYSADSKWWWQVQFDSGTSGYVADDSLEKYVPPAPIPDACGEASDPNTPLLTIPSGTAACTHGAFANSPADTTTAWNWSCGTVTTCSAPKYGCTTDTDTNYNPNGPNNVWGCKLECKNGEKKYPTCTPPVVQCPSGQAYDAATASCVPCSNGGCTGAGGTPSNPTGSLVCNNKSTETETECLAPKTMVNGVCTTPASAPPTTPEISGLWRGSSYLGGTAAANDPNGYQLLAKATSPLGANIIYYFEWQTPGDTAAPQWSEWTGSGGWGSVTHYANYGPGTYAVRAWACAADSNGECPRDTGNWSVSSSDWFPIILTTSSLSVSCSGTPSEPYIDQPVTWSAVVVNGSGSYIYEWSGTDDLFDTAATAQKIYATPGRKQAALMITDSATRKTASATCTSSTTSDTTTTDTTDTATDTTDTTDPTTDTTDTTTTGTNTSIDVKSCTASLVANPKTVEQGLNTTLSWSVSDGELCASSCTGGGFDTDGKISGSAVASILPTPPTTSYALSCVAGTYGPPQPAIATVTVTVPDIIIIVNNQRGGTGGAGGAGGAGSTGGTFTRVDLTVPNNVTLSWAPANSSVESCVVTKDTDPSWKKTGASSGSIVDSATEQTTYTVDCQNKQGAHFKKSVVVGSAQVNYNEF